MTESSSQEVSISGHFNLTHLRPELTLLLIPVPDHLVALIGRIAVAWGGFEWRMDEIIRTTLEGYKREIPGWQRTKFRKRKELFRNLMVEYSTTYCPHETEALRKIAGDSADLHWRRNVIVHGKYAMHSHDPKEKISDELLMFARSEHNGREVEIPINEETLDKLYHDIAHLGGALMMTYRRMGGGIIGPELLIEDKEFLQGPQFGNFQAVPIPHK